MDFRFFTLLSYVFLSFFEQNRICNNITTGSALTTASSSYLKPHTLLPTLAGTSPLSDLRQERDFYTQPLFPVEATQSSRKRPLKAAIDTLMVANLSWDLNVIATSQVNCYLTLPS